MTPRILESEVWLPLPRDQVFAFFGDAQNLNALTPPWLHFHILTPMPIEMKPGALIDYQLRIRGLPVKWRTEITVWEPPFRFVDRQLKGPYRVWNHTHTFTEKDGGTLVHDRVEYLSPGWFLEPLIHRFLVAPDLEKVFAYRKTKIAELLAPGLTK